MNKPFTVACEDFKQELTNIINDSGLPALVIEFVLRDYLSEVKMVAQNQYRSDKARYETALKERSVDAENIGKEGD